jgi:hypothetical protein
MYATNRTSWIHNQDMSMRNCTVDSSDIEEWRTSQQCSVSHCLHVMALCIMLGRNQRSAAVYLLRAHRGIGLFGLSSSSLDSPDESIP